MTLLVADLGFCFLFAGDFYEAENQENTVHDRGFVIRPLDAYAVFDRSSRRHNTKRFSGRNRNDDKIHALLLWHSDTCCGYTGYYFRAHGKKDRLHDRHCIGGHSRDLGNF